MLRFRLTVVRFLMTVVRCFMTALRFFMKLVVFRMSWDVSGCLGIGGSVRTGQLGFTSIGSGYRFWFQFDRRSIQRRKLKVHLQVHLDLVCIFFAVPFENVQKALTPPSTVS